MKEFSESKIRHLEMIQNVVTRMASNSFLLRGWTVTIVVGLFAFANLQEMNPKYILLALIPAFFFWFLDGYFLRQERLFRKLYDYVRISKEDDINFTMNTSLVREQVKGWFRVTLSGTLLLFYVPILFVIISALLILPRIEG